MITEEQFRFRLGKFIFYSILLLFVLLIVFYIISGLDDEEFLELIKLFAPIKAVYITALIKYAISNKREKKTDKRRKKPSFSPIYRSVTRFMVYSHIISLIVLISIYALFNAIEFSMLKNSIIGIETFFGSYIGLLIPSLYSEKDEVPSNI